MNYLFIFVTSLFTVLGGHTASAYWGTQPQGYPYTLFQKLQAPLTNDPRLSAQLARINITSPQVEVPRDYSVEELDYDDPIESHYLAIKFAPLVLFHPQERFFPCSVDWFATHSDLYEGGYEAPRHIKRVEGKGELQSYQDDKGYFLKPAPRTMPVSQFYAGEPLVNGRASAAPVYVNFVEKDQDHAVIQYWFFYSYNGPTVGYHEKGLGIHEGDWEHIDVHLVREEKRFQVEKIFYAAHRANQHGRFVWPKDITYYKGSHPIVFSAKYSHASLPKATRLNAELDAAGVGYAHWPTYNNVVIIGSKEQPKPGQEWINFNGRWGSLGSPETPSYQGYWRNTGREDYNPVQIPSNIVFNGKGKTPYFSLRNAVPTRALQICFQVDSPKPFQYWIMERKHLRKDKVIYGPLQSGTIACQDRARSRAMILGPKDYRDRTIYRGLYFKSDTPAASKGLRPQVLAPEA